MNLNEIRPFSIYVYYLRQELMHTQCNFDHHIMIDEQNRAHEKAYNKNLLRAKVDAANNFLKYFRKQFPNQVTERVKNKIASKEGAQLDKVADNMKTLIPDDLNKL